MFLCLRLGQWCRFVFGVQLRMSNPVSVSGIFLSLAGLFSSTGCSWSRYCFRVTKVVSLHHFLFRLKKSKGVLSVLSQVSSLERRQLPFH